ncbi:hypothetical protein ACWEKT_27245 [Nocardia takedensis]
MLSGGVGTLLRSLLLATLAVAVLGMHHVPGAEHSPQKGHGDGCCEVSRVEMPPAESPVAASSVVDRQPSGHGAGHDLLHLCLAILAAVTGLILLVFAVAWRFPDERAMVWRRRCARGFGRDPPTPTLRRLAVLCVLRQ